MNNELVESQEISKDLALIEKRLDLVLSKDDTFNQISIRGLNDKGLTTFDEEGLNQIAEYMPEINRAMNAFGRNNTQTTNKLMTLTMLNGNGSPYRLLRQALTEIDSKRSALKENTFKLKKTKIELFKLEEKYTNTPDKFDKQLIKLDMEERIAGIQNSMLYIEGALKDIASFQDAYNQIKTSNNIPDNWDEVDMENSETAFHTRRAFELLYRDMIVNGRVGMGTIEYLQQFGIHPQTATRFVGKYIKEVEELCDKDRLPAGDNLDKFLDEMMHVFKDSYKTTLTKVGIDTLKTDFSQYLEASRNEERKLLTE